MLACVFTEGWRDASDAPAVDDSFAGRLTVLKGKMDAVKANVEPKVSGCQGRVSGGRAEHHQGHAGVNVMTQLNSQGQCQLSSGCSVS